MAGPFAAGQAATPTSTTTSRPVTRTGCPGRAGIELTPLQQPLSTRRRRCPRLCTRPSSGARRCRVGNTADPTAASADDPSTGVPIEQPGTAARCHAWTPLGQFGAGHIRLDVRRCHRPAVRLPGRRWPDVSADFDAQSYWIHFGPRKKYAVPGRGPSPLSAACRPATNPGSSSNWTMVTRAVSSHGFQIADVIGGWERGVGTREGDTAVTRRRHVDDGNTGRAGQQAECRPCRRPR